MQLFIVCVVFYLIGSFPTAYVLIKYKYKKNIINEGSGNVGARNTFDITNSKLDGAVVLIADFLKGLIPVLWYINYSGLNIQLLAFPALFLLSGHNFSIWLKFKGGRGLATAAGIMAAINFTLVILWLIFYFLLNKLIRNVHISTVIALILLPFSIVFLQDLMLKYNNPALKTIEDPFRFLFSICSAVCIIILLKHISPIMELIHKKVDS